MRRHAKASSAGSKLRKPSGHGVSPPSGRLRLTILLATVAAFLLVPVAQAAAAPTMTVNIVGTGSGVVTSELKPYGFSSTGIPPIECSYVSPGPATGICEDEMTLIEGKTYFVTMLAIPAAGSVFAGWTVTEGVKFSPCEGPGKLGPGYPCVAGTTTGGNAKVTATFTKAFTLTVVKEGTGAGTVVSSPGGILCPDPEEEFPETCSAPFAEGTVVTLTASPAVNSAFTSWKGCETVEGRKCKVTMSEAKTVKAKFTKTYAVTVKKTAGNTGLGSISGVSCAASCTEATASFLEGKAVKLAPKASKGSEFTEWSSCPGTIVETNKCEMTSAGTAEVKFTATPQFNLTVTKKGGGQGTVKSTPASINCGATCSTATSAFYTGTEVELTASVVEGKGSAFGGWSLASPGGGTCTGLTNPCKMPAITGAQSVTAEFK